MKFGAAPTEEDIAKARREASTFYKAAYRPRPSSQISVDIKIEKVKP
jgi:hypothetical protein